MSLFFLFFFIGESISQQRTFIIKGKIVDEETQLPLEGAIVQISKTTLGATTNSDGNFAIYYVFAGVYSLRFAFVGYGSFQLDSVHIMSDTTLPTIELETSGVTLGCDFHIMTTGELNAIKDSDGLLKQNTIVLISYGLITPEMKEFARKYNFSFRNHEKEDSVYVNIFNGIMRKEILSMYKSKVIRKLDSLLYSK